MDDRQHAPDFAEAVYYRDQAGWEPGDFHVLWRYLNRLILYVGPTPEMLAQPGSRPARIQTKRDGVRDEELAALDLSRMSPETRYLLKHMLITQRRYPLALRRFPNLAGLERVGELGHELQISSEPLLLDDYLTERGILL